jgi:integration host factor subunit beta
MNGEDASMEETRTIGPSGKGHTYTKKDVAIRVARTSDGKVSVSEKWVDRVFHALREIMTSANPELRIEIRDFGVFEVKRTKAKPKARNPRTGEIIFVPARRKTHFKPSKLLRSFLQQPIETGSQGSVIPEAAQDLASKGADVSSAQSGG